MADENETPGNVVEIKGLFVALPSGAEVWGGIHEDSFVWRFTSKEKAITRVCLSHAAMRAMIQLYQDLSGCDRNFASVEIERGAEQRGG